VSEYYYQKIKDGLIDEPEDTPEILAEQQQIWIYMPLVRKLAYQFSFQCNLGYLDICQQGYYILAELTTKIDWQETDVKMISRYVKVSVAGLLRNYCSKYSTIVSSPRGDALIEVVRTEDSEELIGEGLNPEEELEKKQERDQVRFAVALAASILNERETFILWNHCLTDDPMSYREIGVQFNVSYESIRRDYNRVIATLKGFYDEYTRSDS
jgi:RNA polymerase sigma factor (sigma-70 family)